MAAAPLAGWGWGEAGDPQPLIIRRGVWGRQPPCKSPQSGQGEDDDFAESLGRFRPAFSEPEILHVGGGTLQLGGHSTAKSLGVRRKTANPISESSTLGSNISLRRASVSPRSGSHLDLHQDSPRFTDSEAIS